jgi:hypothetical protein
MPKKEERPASVPTSFPDITPPFPSGDYSYVLEIVMRMQETMGGLKEAVAALKDQSKSQGEKIDAIGKDVHAAKVVISVVGGLIVLIGGIVAWLISTYISATHPAK